MRTLTIMFALVASAGCGSLDRVLAVEPVDRVPALPLESSPANAQLLVNGAIADFECAFGAYVVLGGLIGDELEESRSIAERKPFDQRIHTSKDRRYAVARCDQLGVYTPLQTARVSAERVILLLEAWTDAEVAQRRMLVATMHAYAGYATLLLGEGFCSTVLSSPDANGALVYGREITRDSAFRVAESHFTTAIALAEETAASAVLNLALVGRARASLDRGDLTSARGDATRVPSVFTHFMTASANALRRQNRAWEEERAEDIVTVGILYRSLGDPRVPVTDTRRTGPLRVPIFYEEKYPTAASPIRIAGGAEARLIVAEADLATGTPESLQNARSIIDVFRARGNQLPLATSDVATLRAALIDQRRRELFLEGQHLGDIIRFGVALTPPVGAPYPGGGSYGAQRCLPLPDVERENNPALRD
ncbi:MAG TPA: RagB/SusD family nutrient uptake outer membrane protein [Gemmatimonadaceae bacterium]|nr:RagB/SusD family nutrient uptake outer membrane protein [Gemmatimonadaceae bacterium]